MGFRIAACAALVCLGGVAHAQDAATGVVEGTVRTSEGATVSEVIVRVTGPAGEVGAVRADFEGRYRVQGLPPGTYRIGFFVRGTEIVHGEVTIRAGAVTVLPVRGPGTPVARVLDPTSSALTTTIGRDLLQHGVRTGFDLDAMFGVAPGAASDGLGVGFGGADSLENHYVIDDVDVTGAVYPTMGTSLPIDLVSDVQLTTGGARAALGGFTGGFVRVVTPRGGASTHGSVFATIAPYVAARERAPAPASSLDVETEPELAMIGGATLSGPVVKDHAWYWVGVVPSWSGATVTRTTRTRVDRDQDGDADVDPDTGFEIYERLDDTSYATGTRGVLVAGKLDVAVVPAHQGGLSVMVAPAWEHTARGHGIVAEQGLAIRELTTDVAARWLSRWTKSSLGAVVGVHRAGYRLRSADGRDDVPLQVLGGGNLGEWAKLGGESEATRQGCDDEGDDPYPGITNCPVSTSYAIGGPGYLTDDTQQRVSVEVVGARRASFLGLHTTQLGIGVDDARSAKSRLYSGGRQLDHSLAGVGLSRYVELRDAGAPGTAPCLTFEGDLRGCEAIVAGDDAASEPFRSFGWSLFFEETWRPITGLTMELGLRRDTQSIHDTFELPPMWSSRFGMAYDPSGEGRSRIYAHYGTFHERLPLSIAERLSSRAALERRRYAAEDCGGTAIGFGGPDGAACDPDDPSIIGDVSASQPLEVDPELSGQWLDESILGYDREVRPGVTFGIAYLHRQLWSVVEDVAGDDPLALRIANPGVGFGQDADPPRRDHQALQLRLSARLWRRFAVEASYVLSDVDGNYPGLHSPNNGQVEPNVSSQWDFAELGANRDGALPQDRPHDLKLDTFYTLRGVTLGARVRALSGTPIGALARHPTYGLGEVFLLPRGALGRTPFTTGLDLHADYTRTLGRYQLTVFADLLNVANHQGAFTVDEDYTSLSSALPIVGGSYADLIFAKESSIITGAETSTPLRRNPHFGRPETRYAPLSLSLGARLTF